MNGKISRWPKSKAFHGGLALSTAFGEVDHLKGSRKVGWLDGEVDPISHRIFLGDPLGLIYIYIYIDYILYISIIYYIYVCVFFHMHFLADF